MKKVILSLLLLFVMPAGILYGDGNTRGEGMGGAVTALNDSTGSIYNPVLTTGVEKFTFIFESGYIKNKRPEFNTGFVTPQKKWGNISVHYYSQTEKQSKNYNSLAINYSLKIFKLLSVGTRLESCFSKIKNITWNNLSCSLGLNLEIPVKKILEYINLGAAYKNINPNFSGKSWISTADLTIGTALKLRLVKPIPTNLTFDTEIISGGKYCRSGSLIYAFGIEQWIESSILKFGIRTGFKYYGINKLSHAIGGSLWFKSIQLNYTFIYHSNQIVNETLYQEEYDSHKISMSILFNKRSKEEPENNIPAQNVEEQELETEYRINYKINYTNPQFKVDVLPAFINNDINAIKFKILSFRNEDIKSWTFEIYNGDSECIKKWKDEGIPLETIIWNGYDDKGNYLDINNKYSYQLIVEYDNHSEFRTGLKEIKFNILVN